MRIYWSIASLIFIVVGLYGILFVELTEVEQLASLVAICTGTIISAIATVE